MTLPPIRQGLSLQQMNNYGGFADEHDDQPAFPFNDHTQLPPGHTSGQEGFNLSPEQNSGYYHGGGGYALGGAD